MSMFACVFCVFVCVTVCVCEHVCVCMCEVRACPWVCMCVNGEDGSLLEHGQWMWTLGFEACRLSSVENKWQLHWFVTLIKKKKEFVLLVLHLAGVSFPPLFLSATIKGLASAFVITSQHVSERGKGEGFFLLWKLEVGWGGGGEKS